MTQAHSNVGHVDALARRVVGFFAVLGGVASIDSFFFVMPFLTWLVLAFMFCTGLFFLLAGTRGGTGIFGLLTMLLAGLFGWLAVSHQGHWALIIGLVVAADAFITAQVGWSPINALLHRDTHQADSEWKLPPAGVH